MVKLIARTAEAADYRVEEVGEDVIQKGFFCNKCNDWVWYDVRDKLYIDETLYHLEADLEGAGDKVREEILGMANGLRDREVAGNRIMVNDQARNLSGILSMMETYDLDYEIEPPFPHKILRFNKK